MNLSETIIDAVNDLEDHSVRVAIFYEFVKLHERIAELEADLEATRRERDQYLDELIHWKTGRVRDA